LSFPLSSHPPIRENVTIMKEILAGEVPVSRNESNAALIKPEVAPWIARAITRRTTQRSRPKKRSPEDRKFQLRFRSARFGRDRWRRCAGLFVFGIGQND